MLKVHDLDLLLSQGDNQYRVSGQALEFKQLNIHAWEAFEKGQDIHMQATPSQAELLYKNYKIIKEKLKSQMKEALMEKYDNAATEEKLPKELLLGETERQVEYDRVGRVIGRVIRGMVSYRVSSFLKFHLVLGFCRIMTLILNLIL
jgi:fatty acid-binding protein DegV